LPDQPNLPVAIFTDDDLDHRNSLTVSLHQAVRRAPPDLRPRVYSAGPYDINTRDYFAAAAGGLRLPYYRHRSVYRPRLRRFRGELEADSVAVIHVTTPGPVGLAGRRLARLLNLPLVGSCHTDFGQSIAAVTGSPRLAAVFDRYAHWFFGRCEPLFVPSLAGRARLGTHGYTGRLGVWRCGVDAQRFGPFRASAGLRERWHVDHRRPAILYAGRLSREQGLSLLPLVQRMLERQRIAHRFVFVGEGPMTTELRERCPEAAFMGSLDGDDAARALASADIVIAPGAIESAAQAVLEAQACGVPVAVPDAGGVHEYVIPDRTAIVCRAGEPGSFAEQLALLLRQPSARREMGQAARDFALTQTWAAALAPLFDAWREQHRGRVRHPRAASSSASDKALPHSAVALHR
jgi:glycosyltransferase involved in cell wall biosynthesis